MDVKSIIQEIESDENKRRKAEHAKRHDVYNDYQRAHVIKMLTQEFSIRTVSEMRTCTSINLSRRMVNEMASIYKKDPTRTVEMESENDTLEENILNLYEEFRINTYMKRANQKYKLHDQCAIQVIPKDGKITFRILSPHQYDVIPDPDNPEVALAYVISTYDRGQLDSAIQGNQDVQGNYYGSKNEQTTTSTDKAIADQNDYQATLKKFVIWTKDEIIKATSNGQVMERVPNPIGVLPFVDVACDKDFEFWIRRGSGVVDFSLDFSVVLSDTCNTNRLQSYAQPVITAEKIPESVTVGPQHILFLPLDPTRPEMKPSFEFASPNPDLKASLDLQDRLLNYFMSSRGIDPKSINSSGEGNKYTSGLERLLAMIERFEASQDDLDLFYYVECELFKLLRSWYNVIRGTDSLDPMYDFGEWPENTYLNTVFAGPEMLQTSQDKEDSVVRRLDNGLMSKVEAIMELRNISQDEAEKVIAEIDSIPQPQPAGKLLS